MNTYSGTNKKHTYNMVQKLQALRKSLNFSDKKLALLVARHCRINKKIVTFYCSNVNAGQS